MRGSAAMARLEGLFAVLVWGGSFIATKIAVAQVAPVTVVWLRFAMGVAILVAFVAVRRQFAWPPPRELAQFAVLGFIGITFHQWLQSNALRTAHASTSGWIVASTPVFIALLARMALGERLSWDRVAGIALAAAGVVLVVTRGHPTTLLAGRFGEPGDLAILISAPNWAIFSVLSRRVLRTHPAARVMLYVMTLGWLLTSVQFFAGPGPVDAARLDRQGWAAILFLGIACSGLAYVAWYDALERLPASEVGAFLYLEPLVAMGVAALVLGEPIGAAMLIGGAVILFGIWLVNRPRRTPPASESVGSATGPIG